VGDAADTLEDVLARRVVPVVVLGDAALAAPLGEALVAGGLPVAEVTFRTGAAEEALRALAGRGDVLVGAGTVTRPETVDRAVDAGACFVVTPGLSASVVERCRARGVPVVPGVATATELMGALELGCEVVKLFPAEAAGGVATVKALAAPFPGVRFVPTGGISAANARDYLALGCVAAVGGSWMVAPDLLAAGDLAEVTRRSAEAVALAGAA
jgi:2-dehydro-3-deoxyphosphogluconate aldolase / (4S)-4-hydroxy-2-oxoglutarate aldolase